MSWIYISVWDWKWQVTSSRFQRNQWTRHTPLSHPKPRKSTKKRQKNPQKSWRKRHWPASKDQKWKVNERKTIEIGARELRVDSFPPDDPRRHFHWHLPLPYRVNRDQISSFLYIYSSEHLQNVERLTTLDVVLNGTMNQEALSFTLTQITHLLSNLNKKNYTQNSRQLASVSRATACYQCRFPIAHRTLPFLAVTLPS